MDYKERHRKFTKILTVHAAVPSEWTLVKGHCCLIHFFFHLFLAKEVKVSAEEFTFSDLQMTKMTASYQTNISPTTLYIYQTLQTTKLSFEKPARLTSFQKPQLQSVLIFKLVHPCLLLYQLAVLFIPSFNILSHSFDVLHSRCLNFDEFPDSAL